MAGIVRAAPLDATARHVADLVGWLVGSPGRPWLPRRCCLSRMSLHSIRVRRDMPSLILIPKNIVKRGAQEEIAALGALPRKICGRRLPQRLGTLGRTAGR